MNLLSFKRIISGTIAASLLLQTGMAFADTAKAVKTGSITYQEIGDQYINSFGAVELDEPKATPADKKKIDLTLPSYTEAQLRKMNFELMARNEKSTDADFMIHEALRITLKDLDVYYGNGKSAQENLMAELNDCNTIFGETVMAHMLAHPLSDVAQLEKRQAFIKELVENEELFAQLSAILDAAKNAESGFFSYWQPNDPASEKLFKDLYFAKPGFKNLNDNPYALETLIRLGNAETACKIGGLALAGVAINYGMLKAGSAAAEKYGLRDDKGDLIFKVDTSLKKALENTWYFTKSYFDPRGYVESYKSIEPNLAQMMKDHVAANGEPLPDLAVSILRKGAKGFIFTKGALALGIIALQAYITKNTLSGAAQTKNSINYLQARLIDVATIVDTCKKLQEVTKANAAMSAGLNYGHELSNLLDASSASDFAKLIELLQTNTFKNNASFFSLSGRVLAANQLMNAQKEHFALALQAIGEIDACLSIAKLYKKMKHERVGYCFVDFAKSETPALNAVDFWNPFVDYNVVVTNSIALGKGADASKIILTGSNTGGKSTILRGIMIGLLLGHTFGIAPAAQFSMSPFAFIGSYLRVNDDTSSGESKFKAEVLRAKMLCDTMDSLPKNQFGFVVIDELFTGTGSEKAANGAYKVAEKLATHQNSLYILATHFPVLTKLEEKYSGLIKNCKVEVYKDDAGNLVRPFKLEAGISSSNIANDILNEEIKDIDFGI